MILIADSGSTKTDWRIFEEGRKVVECKTQGINPYQQSSEDILNILQSELVSRINHVFDVTSHISSIFFYGSGCRNEKVPVIMDLLRQVFQNVDVIEVGSDLLGTARALCWNNEGIACILGTGANSCLYDGEKIIRNTPPLGYILGDEGSGAILGRNFVNALFKGLLSVGLRSEFTKHTGLTIDDVMNRVYSTSLPNRFLASLSPFIHEHLDDKAVRAMVQDSFRMFIRRNIVPYDRPELPINFVGSVAFHYKPLLEEAVKDEGYNIGVVERSPMEGLTKYHIA